MSKPNIYTKKIISPIGQMLAAAADEEVFFLSFAERLDIGFRLRKAMKKLEGSRIT